MSGRPLAGVVPGVAAVAVVLLALRLAGVPPLLAFALADLVGVGVALGVGRGRAGAANGLAVTLVLSYSLLVGVLVTFVLAVLDVG